VNGGPNTLIGATSAHIAGHRGIDVGVAWLRRAGKQCRCRHDLTGLAIAALDDIELEPRLPQRFPYRRLADRLNSGDALSPMASIRVTHARAGTPSICTVHAPHSATPHPNLVPTHAEHVAQHPEQGVSASTSALCAVPLTLIVNAID